jgi:hypothetical protein
MLVVFLWKILSVRGGANLVRPLLEVIELIALLSQVPWQGCILKSQQHLQLMCLAKYFLKYLGRWVNVSENMGRLL